MMRIVLALALSLTTGLASAQQASQLATFNESVSIATANTYQALSMVNQAMRSLTIQNNNVNTDNCWVDISGLITAGMTTAAMVTPPGNPAITAAKASILLTPSQSYSRYFPHLPVGPIVGTCATAGDSIYVDWQ